MFSLNSGTDAFQTITQHCFIILDKRVKPKLSNVYLFLKQVLE